MPNNNAPVFDLTVTISAILAICAIVSPIITTLLNNSHQQKMEKLKIASGQKFSAIEHYLNAAGKYISYDAPANFIAYGEAKGMVYLYITRSSWKVVDELDELIMNGDSDKARELFPKVCKELSKTMKD